MVVIKYHASGLTVFQRIFCKPLNVYFPALFFASNFQSSFVFCNSRNENASRPNRSKNWKRQSVTLQVCNILDWNTQFTTDGPAVTSPRFEVTQRTNSRNEVPRRFIWNGTVGRSDGGRCTETESLCSCLSSGIATKYMNADAMAKRVVARIQR